jgi:hypothetical protein
MEAVSTTWRRRRIWWHSPGALIGPAIQHPSATPHSLLILPPLLHSTHNLPYASSSPCRIAQRTEKRKLLKYLWCTQYYLCQLRITLLACSLLSDEVIERCRGQHCCFVFRFKSRTEGAFCDILSRSTRILIDYLKLAPPRPLVCKSFKVHYSLITLSFDYTFWAIYSVIK